MARPVYVSDTFYKQSDYSATTRATFASSSAPRARVFYEFESRPTVVRYALEILSIPLIPCRVLHAMAGKFALLPAATPSMLGLPGGADTLRRYIDVDGTRWKIERFAVKCDGRMVDCYRLGRERFLSSLRPFSKSTFDTGRCAIVSLGNGTFAEDNVTDDRLKTILNKIDGYAVCFNYPGVGGSSGFPNRWAMGNAGRAVLECVEKRLGAKKIVWLAQSIGGGVQAAALKNYKPAPGVDLIGVKFHTFSSLTDAATHLTIRPLGWLVAALGWSMPVVQSSMNQTCPEVVFQTADVKRYTDLRKHPAEVLGDGIIQKKAALAPHLLANQAAFKGKKWIIGTPRSQGHNDPFRQPAYIGNLINKIWREADRERLPSYLQLPDRILSAVW